MTNAELAILSLVAERPHHGYEVEQVIEARGMRDWTEIGFSSIYYVLKKLEAEGLVQAQSMGGDRGPKRRVFQITEIGRAAWQAAVLNALSTPQRCHPPVLLGLSCWPAIPSPQALAALESYRGALESRLERVQQRRAAQQPLPYFVDAMFEHSVALLEAELAWLSRFIQRVEIANDTSGFQERIEAPLSALSEGV